MRRAWPRQEMKNDRWGEGAAQHAFNSTLSRLPHEGTPTCYPLKRKSHKGIPTCYPLKRIQDRMQERGGHQSTRDLVDQRVKRLLIAIGVRTLSLGKRFEPVGDLVKALFACRFGHARVHVGVFVRFAGDGSLQVFAG